MADNVVSILVTSKNATKAGLAAAKADAEGAAASIGQIFEKMNQKLGKDFGSKVGELGKSLKPAAWFAGGSGALAMATPLAAAGVAMGAFGAVAIPVLSKVSAAQAALNTAQQAYASATTAAQRQAALKAEVKATDNLSVSQKGLLGPLTQIKAAFSRLQDTATPAIGALLRLGTSLMPLFGALVKAGGALVLAVAGPLAVLIRSPFFTM